MPTHKPQSNSPQKKTAPKFATVLANHPLSPNMLRIVLQSDEFKTLQTTDFGGYIKLLFHPEGHTDISLLADDERPIMRTYTISSLDIENGMISVDFMKHVHQSSTQNINPETGGYAIAWAMNAKAGDTIYIGGPGKSQEIDFNAKQLFLIADMTAIPALASQLPLLSDDAQGAVILQLQSMEDMPKLSLPKGMKVHVMLSDLPFKLAQTVGEVEIESDDIAIWCACEFMAMKAIRAYFNEKNRVQRGKSYFSSYWKEGVTEDGHKLIKREDAKSQSL